MEYRNRHNQGEEEDISEDRERLAWEEEQKQLDRDWYNIEESSGVSYNINFTFVIDHNN